MNLIQNHLLDSSTWLIAGRASYIFHFLVMSFLFLRNYFFQFYFKCYFIYKSINIFNIIINFTYTGCFNRIKNTSPIHIDFDRSEAVLDLLLILNHGSDLKLQLFSHLTVCKSLIAYQISLLEVHCSFLESYF